MVEFEFKLGTVKTYPQINDFALQFLTSWKYNWNLWLEFNQKVVSAYKFEINQLHIKELVTAWHHTVLCTVYRI